MKDANDGKPWTEIDVRGLMAALRVGDTIEEAAAYLCRSGTIKDVRHKAEELGLKYKSRGEKAKRRWMVALIKGTHAKELGYVYAEDDAEAMKEAVKEFKISEDLRDRIVVTREDY
jgi:hypothetical protein